MDGIFSFFPPTEIVLKSFMPCTACLLGRGADDRTSECPIVKHHTPYHASLLSLSASSFTFHLVSRLVEWFFPAEDDFLKVFCVIIS